MNICGGKKSAIFVFVALLLIVIYIVYEYLTKTDQHLVENFLETDKLSNILSKHGVIQTKPSSALSISDTEDIIASPLSQSQIKSSNVECNDQIWCRVPMPTKSLFRFSTPPNDPLRWREAQKLAAIGDPVLLRRIVKYFPNYMDFLDGDILFRSTHMNMDYFFGRDGNLSFLTIPPSTSGEDVPINEIPNSNHIPSPYYAQKFNRAPIIRAGYANFERDGPIYFQGRKVGEVIVNVPRIIVAWEKVHMDIKTPFIMLSSFNENWGLLSGLFPNRTADWLPWPSRRAYVGLNHILNNSNTLLFLVNQHRNFTHPKLVTLPRGIPGYIENHKRLLWDMMMDEYTTKDLKAESFVFVASSNWRHRPRIKECIRSKFPRYAHEDMHEKEKGKYFNSTNGFEVHGFNEQLKGRISTDEYYRRLVRAKVSIAIPGLGYDTHRLWESLTLGVVAVIERGVGLDRTVCNYSMNSYLL